MPSDTTLTCRDCRQPFVLAVREQEYYATRGFDNPPGRCPDCRAAHKAERGHERRSSRTRGAREMLRKPVMSTRAVLVTGTHCTLLTSPPGTLERTESECRGAA